jgi:DNA-binding NarL/FixJ family response regulator
MQTRLIIALPNRLCATGLARHIEVLDPTIKVCGVATGSKQIFELLAKCPATVLLYDPYLPGAAPEVVCCRLNREFFNVKTILMKNPTANGRFLEAQKFTPAAILSSEAKPLNLIELLRNIDGERDTKEKVSKSLKAKPSKKSRLETKTRETRKPKSNNLPLQQLSEREKEIIMLTSRGHSSREIGFALGISNNTVRTHTQNILSKLQLNSKIQLISWYASIGD